MNLEVTVVKDEEFVASLRNKIYILIQTTCFCKKTLAIELACPYLIAL
jgi:hypothetical protein